MENATKALLIGASVLIGMVIISLAVYLYMVIGSYIDSSQESLEQAALTKFNTQFFNYVTETGEELSFQEVISAANLAYENNYNAGFTGNEDVVADGITSDYVEVKIIGYNKPKADGSGYDEKNGATNSFNLEKVVGDADALANWLKFNYSFKYTCSFDDIGINYETGRVYSIVFKRI